MNLPVEEVLDDLKRHLLARDEVVLTAPPGAGKTTLVPLALLQEPWLNGRKILMLEPRRLATRSAAWRMASLLGEKPGQTVGYRMRLDTNVGKHTRVEVITEGILTRMLQQDPALEDVGLVIFDEFHERNLDSDLGLSLCLQARTLFRDNADNTLKIVIMSATLDSQRVADLLDEAPVVSSEGRQYPVDIIYGRASQPRDRIVDLTVAALKRIIDDNPESSILVFLPGQGEISRTADELQDWISNKRIKGLSLHPLFGNLSFEAQQRAIEPLDSTNESKVVLATNIAETSLTIEGIDIVVDSGLVRQPVFDPATGMTRLHTRKISNSSSIQRAGRAGRLKPGRCYRLWSADQQQQLAPYNTPEILQADLAPLVLQLLQWGIDDANDMRWLDPPPAGPWQQAVDLLVALDAITKSSDTRLRLTPHGRIMSELPVHPRLAHLMICGARINEARTASMLASFLSDRDPFQNNADVNYRLAVLSGETRCPQQNRGWQQRTRQLAQQFEEQIKQQDIGRLSEDERPDADLVIGYLLASAYPDRIARRRHSGGYQLANGRSANLADMAQFGKTRWLAVAEVGGMARSKGDTIRSAAPLDPALFDSLLNHLGTDETIADWDNKTNRFVAERQQKIGALILKREALNKVPLEAKNTALIQYIQKRGIEILPWSAELRQWQARVLLLRSFESKLWPDITDETLSSTMASWLAPFLEPIRQLNDFKKLDLKKILGSQLTWKLSQRLDQLAPKRFEVPSGSSIAIDYSQSPPLLAVKLQEMFGCEQTPAIADGKITLLVHLLSPAGRPLQVTQDLAGFWRSSYHDVKKEMKGRYPKHPWPDDPLLAIATRKTKARPS